MSKYFDQQVFDPGAFIRYSEGDVRKAYALTNTDVFARTRHGRHGSYSGREQFHPGLGHGYLREVRGVFV